MRLLLLLLLLPLPLLGQESNALEFIWGQAEGKDQKFDKASLLVPISRENDSNAYYLQFDTGATRSMFYSQRIDEEKFLEEIKGSIMENLKFEKNSIMPPSKNGKLVIGTLGADFLKGRIVNINFPQQRITLITAYDPSPYQTFKMRSLNGRPVVQLMINGKAEDLLFDTGSSLFGLWTSKRNWKRLIESANTADTFPIRSWGQWNLGYYAPVAQTVVSEATELLAGASVSAWYVDNRKFKRFFRRNGLFGILGMQAFYDKEVVIDTEKGLLGVRDIR